MAASRVLPLAEFAARRSLVTGVLVKTKSLVGIGRYCIGKYKDFV